MGRPTKEFDREIFENLCGIMCTESEICSVFNTTDKTLSSWCRRVYHESFSEIYKKLTARGKISLRRNQFKLSQKSPAMAIFLGKQYLGQKDVIEYGTEVEEDTKDAVERLLHEIEKGTSY